LSNIIDAADPHDDKYAAVPENFKNMLSTSIMHNYPKEFLEASNTNAPTISIEGRRGCCFQIFNVLTSILYRHRNCPISGLMMELDRYMQNCLLSWTSRFINALIFALVYAGIKTISHVS